MGRSHIVGSPILALGLLVGGGPLMAQGVDGALSGASAMDDAARSSQARIDKVFDETRDLVRQYGTITKEVDGLDVYNTLLQKQVENQAQEATDLRDSIEQVSVIVRPVVPLMVQMVESLKQFVDLDLPFLLPERRKRVTFLETLLERSDVTVAEKLRRVLEAYEIENDYGRTIETYKDSLDLEGASREVDFLRIGRVALFYQTVDAGLYGMWDKDKKAWTSLPGEYRNQIREGIRVARKQVAPNLLLLPVHAPENAR